MKNFIWSFDSVSRIILVISISSTQAFALTNRDYQQAIRQEESAISRAQLLRVMATQGGQTPVPANALQIQRNVAMAGAMANRNGANIAAWAYQVEGASENGNPYAEAAKEAALNSGNPVVYRCLNAGIRAYKQAKQNFMDFYKAQTDRLNALRGGGAGQPGAMQGGPGAMQGGPGGNNPLLGGIGNAPGGNAAFNAAVNENIRLMRLGGDGNIATVAGNLAGRNNPGDAVQQLIAMNGFMNPQAAITRGFGGGQAGQWGAIFANMLQNGNGNLAARWLVGIPAAQQGAALLNIYNVPGVQNADGWTPAQLALGNQLRAMVANGGADLQNAATLMNNLWGNGQDGQNAAAYLIQYVGAQRAQLTANLIAAMNPGIQGAVQNAVHDLDM